MPEEAPDTRVRLIAQGSDLWKVQVLFEDGLEAQIPDRLRAIKQDLASGFGVPDSLLEYVNMLSKRRTNHGTLVEIQIRRQPIPSGETVLRYLSAEAADGTEFSNMRIEADICPLDAHGKETTRRMIESLLVADGVDLTQVDWGLIEDTLQAVRENAVTKRGVIIGKGDLPETGSYSKISFPVSSDDEKLSGSAWMGLRNVTAGDMLIEVSGSIGSLNAGKNVFGREIDPVRPFQTRLEAGNGCTLSARGNFLIAESSGLLVLTRSYLDRRLKDSRTAQPAKIRADVEAPDCHDGNRVIELRASTPTLIYGDLKAGSFIHADSHLVVYGNVESNTQIDCLGSLRIIGNIENANISAKEHLCIAGNARDSFINSDLTAQIEGQADECTLYAREILAGKLVGGTAEALTQSLIYNADSESDSTVQVNHRKFLEIQQREGVTAIRELREQMAIVIDLFGVEIVQKVLPENVHLMLLRWLRRQKSCDHDSYSFRDVQEFRTILQIVPSIREQLTAVGTELRDITSRLEDVPDKENTVDDR